MERHKVIIDGVDVSRSCAYEVIPTETLEWVAKDIALELKHRVYTQAVKEKSDDT